MLLRRIAVLTSFVITACLLGCGGGGNTNVPQPLPVTITISGDESIMNTGTTRTFQATVRNAANSTVTWAIVEPTGGAITQEGVYTAPNLPGTFTVKATSQADASASATIRIPVVIPVGQIPGYDVAVDYHGYGPDFQHEAFITTYNKPEVRDAVRAQLQGMADRGATVIFTHIWFVTEPGTTDFGETWRTTFPMSDQEQANLHEYAQDVAAIQGSGGNRLRLDLCMFWLGAADYNRGNPVDGLGSTPITSAEFTRRVELTTDKVLAAVHDVTRPDGVRLVDSVFLEGELMIGIKANQDWFMTTHYPRFVSKVTEAGFRPSVYFIAVADQNSVFMNDWTDSEYPILNGHVSMIYIYKSLKFMTEQGLFIPPRIDFSCYVSSTGAPDSQILQRILDDADATLTWIGVSKPYGIAETFYFADAAQRRELGQAFVGEAARGRLQRVSFWTTPDGGGPGQNVQYPFAIEDYYPPPTN